MFFFFFFLQSLVSQLCVFGLETSQPQQCILVFHCKLLHWSFQIQSIRQFETYMNSLGRI